MRRKNKTLYLCQGAIIAAAYVVLTFVSHLFGLDSGVVQLRISEALCVLPAFTPAAISGLYLGCLLSNLLMGGVWLDILVGPIATLLGAVGTYLLRKYKILLPLPAVLANMLIVPVVLACGYGMEQGYPLLLLGVGVGELISAYVLGMVLATAISKNKRFIFSESD